VRSVQPVGPHPSAYPRPRLASCRQPGGASECAGRECAVRGSAIDIGRIGLRRSHRYAPRRVHGRRRTSPPITRCTRRLVSFWPLCDRQVLLTTVFSSTDSTPRRHRGRVRPARTTSLGLLVVHPQPPHTHTHARTCAHVCARTRTCTLTRSLRPSRTHARACARACAETCILTHERKHARMHARM
jgi:hypothetical protein